MPFDSNGTFNRVRSWVSDAAANIKIRADYHDAHDGDLAAGLSTCITKDGRTQPTADIPMNGKKIVNMGNTVGSDPPNTAATKSYVDGARTFTTGMNISGANWPNGFLSFDATTGITGISWANSNMSWVSKTADAGKWRERIAAVDNPQGTGLELVSIDKGGIVGILSGIVTQNLSFDGTNYRVDKTGTGSRLVFKDGALKLASNDTATLQDNQTATLQDFWTVDQSTMALTGDTNAILNLQKKDGTHTYVSRVAGYCGGALRWIMDLGNATAETATDLVGSDFALYAYNNAGGGAKTMLTINRSSNLATFTGYVASLASVFQGSATVAILAAGANGGAIYLRPNGPTATTEQCFISTIGDWHISSGHLYVDANTTKGSYLGMGQQGRNGTTGGYSGFWHNWLYSGGLVYMLVNSTNIGAIQEVCDYRTKRNVAALPGMWDKVRALRPVSYQYKGVPDLIEGDRDDDEIRWGFVAHELQGALTKHAATGTKDGKDAEGVNMLQSPNLMVVVAALTKALQEAMDRIEALEARP